MPAELHTFGVSLWVQVFQEHGSWFSPFMAHVNGAQTEVWSRLKNMWPSFCMKDLWIQFLIYICTVTDTYIVITLFSCKLLSNYQNRHICHTVWHMAYVYSIQCMLLSSTTFSRTFHYVFWWIKIDESITCKAVEMMSENTKKGRGHCMSLNV